jgi:Na+:H+ antiporter, NhaA family
VRGGHRRLYLVGGLIFGRHPAVPFLLLLAIFSDAIGLALIATLNQASPGRLAAGAALMAIAIGSAVELRRHRFLTFWPYMLISGTLSWFALFIAGVHPALALVPIVPLLPHATRDAGLFVEPTPRAHDALTRFEQWCKWPVHVILFMFGVVNAGVPLRGLEAGSWAVPIATLAGRPLGIVVATELAVAAGLKRITGVGWRELLVLGCTTSVGLTVALFFATAAMPIGPLLLETKMGALLTVTGVGLAFGLASLMRVGRYGK